MINTRTFAIAGGDLRHAHIANMLAEKENGYKVYGMFFDREVRLSSNVNKSNDIRLVLPQCDVIIFPLPMLSADGYINTPLCDEKISLVECLDYICPESVVLGGKIPPDIMAEAYARGIDMIDYLEREEFAIYNAVPTAEGAIEIAMGELPVTLFGSTCLVIGYGRIGKALARLLHAFGADVRVVARKHSDLAWIRMSGCTPVHITDIGAHLKDANVLFNTVPAVILGEEKLSQLKRNCLVIDLASKPGGVDFETAKSLGIKTIWALSLPGKVAPISAGEIILSTVNNILGEKGVY